MSSHQSLSVVLFRKWLIKLRELGTKLASSAEGDAGGGEDRVAAVASESLRSHVGSDQPLACNQLPRHQCLTLIEMPSITRGAAACLASEKWARATSPLLILLPSLVCHIFPMCPSRYAFYPSRPASGFWKADL